MHDRHNKLMQSIYSFRGAIINEHIMLERMIDFYLSNTFGKDNKTATQLRDWVFTERIPFEPKIQILKLTINSHNPKFNEKYPNYFSDLNDINDMRIILAHHLLINDDNAIELYEKEKTFSFAKFKKDSDIIYIIKKQTDNMIALISKYVPVFMELAEFK